MPRQPQHRLHREALRLVPRVADGAHTHPPRVGESQRSAKRLVVLWNFECERVAGAPAVLTGSEHHHVGLGQAVMPDMFVGEARRPFGISRGEITRLMLNALFILNGGGIAALPTIKALSGSISDSNLTYSGGAFFLGLVFALISGVATIWNYRKFASYYEAQMHAALREANGEIKSIIHFVPSPELKKQKEEADVAGKRSINTTFFFGWVFGVLSAIAFVYGGAQLGGNLNPVCNVLSYARLCFTS